MSPSFARDVSVFIFLCPQREGSENAGILQQFYESRVLVFCGRFNYLRGQGVGGEGTLGSDHGK